MSKKIDISPEELAHRHKWIQEWRDAQQPDPIQLQIHRLMQEIADLRERVRKLESQ